MFAMGCSVTMRQVLDHLIKPIPVIVAMICQFLIFPFISFMFIKFLSIESLNATGILILATCPGGVLSNIFTFFWNGDISLSITMTTGATIIALLAMPFNLWLYGRNLETETLVIPYMQMTFTLVFITIPVLFGIAINVKFSKISPYITKIGSMAGFAIIIVCQTLEVIIFPTIFDDIPLEVLLADIVLPIIGLAVGYLTASLLCLNHKIKKTIAVEIGVKNIGTAITIIMLSFPLNFIRQTILFPFLYTFTSLFVLIIATAMIKICEYYFGQPSEPESIEDLKASAATQALLDDESNLKPIVVQSGSQYRRQP